jgi:hypothetical protein
VVLAALAVAVNKPSGGPAPVGGVPPAIRAGVDEYNTWVTTTGGNGVFGRVANLERDFGASSRCGVGFDADFPERVLITALSSSGPWAQVSVDPGRGVDTTSWREGGDYRSAGIDPADLEANTWLCYVGYDGLVRLGPGD